LVGLAISFAIITALSAHLFYVVTYRGSTSPNSLTYTWIGSMVVGGIALVGVGTGEWMSFRKETKEKIESAW